MAALDSVELASRSLWREVQIRLEQLEWDVCCKDRKPLNSNKVMVVALQKESPFLLSWSSVEPSINITIGVLTLGGGDTDY